MSLPPIALSIRQPWAWAIVCGFKDIENRTAFAINKGGMQPKEICVHASKGMTRHEYESTRNFMAEQGVICPHPSNLFRGGIIGTCTVVDVVMEHESPWFFGPRGLVLKDQRVITPIPCNGALGYFKWTVGTESFEEPKPWMKNWGKSNSEQVKSLFGGDL
jgi:hypothetical protein